MSKTENSALIALIVKVVDSRLKKILPELIEKYINESVNIDIDNNMIENITRSAKKKMFSNTKQIKKSSHNGNLMEMLMDDDDDDLVVTDRSSSRKIEAAKIEKKQKIENKTYVKNNPILDTLLKQTAKEIIDDPSKRVKADSNVGLEGEVIGAQVVRQSANFNNRQLKEVMQASGADANTAALLSRNYSGMFKSSKKSNTNRRVIEPIVDEDDSNYNYLDPNYGYSNNLMSNSYQQPVENTYYEEQPAQMLRQPAQMPVTLSNNPNARVAIQDNFPSEDDFLPPDILAELRNNDSYNVERGAHG